MKFETYAHKIVPDHQLNFHKDPCKDARTRGENARTCDALQKFRYESTKIKKMRFSAIFEKTPKNFLLRVLNFFRGAKRGFPQKISTLFASVLCYYTRLILQTIKVVKYCCLPIVI